LVLNISQQISENNCILIAFNPPADKTEEVLMSAAILPASLINLYFKPQIV